MECVIWVGGHNQVGGSDGELGCGQDVARKCVRRALVDLYGAVTHTDRVSGGFPVCGRRQDRDGDWVLCVTGRAVQ